MARLSHEERKAWFYAEALRVGVTVLGAYVNVRTPVLCRCAKGHSCSPRPLNIQQGHSWCLTCIGRNPQINSESFVAHIEGLGGSVLEPYSNNHSPITCLCPVGHLCSPRPKDVLLGKHGMCVSCTGSDKVVGEASFRSLASQANVLIVGPYANARTRLDCVCPKGHAIRVLPASIQQGRGWCTKCTKGSIDRLYLVYGKFGGDWWAKYGLSANSARVRVHVSKGWRLYRQWTDLDHDYAWLCESIVKSYLRDVPKIDKSLIPQRGYSETFPLEYLSAVEQWFAHLLEYCD